MKKLNKHPRLYKKMANTLKKLITNRIKLSRPKMLPGQQNKGANNSIKNQGNNNYFQQPQIPPNNKLHKNINNTQNDFSRIINVASFRKIPYNDFILRLTPYDYETYLKMIKMNYSCRLEIHLTNIRPMKFILEVLLEKWKNIPKIEPKINLYLIPIRELWIPKELIFFSINDCDRIYDIGDIYTAYGSPSTNILHMKYQWNEDKLNLISNLNNLNQYNNSFNNTLLAQQNDSMLLSESNINNNNNNLGNKLKLSASNLLNASHRTFINNNQINFNSNRAIKGEESQDMFDLSDLDINNSLNNENEEESDDKKNINITQSLNKNDAYNNILDKLSDQDSMFPLDTELLDPMELLGFDGDKKFDNLSNSTSNKIKTNSKGKKNHLNLRHKKISFVNNIKPTESMINSSFANNNKNNNNNNSNLKLRTGYSEVFSNNNSNVNNNNVNNNLNNLAYTSNNNLSEVSSHINNSNHYMNFNSEIGKQISNNKTPSFIIGNNNSEKKEIKNINSILNSNSNLEEDSKLKLRNLTDPNNAETKQNIIINNDLNLNPNQNSSIRKKKKLKFVNNVSKENIQEIKQNSLSIFDKPEIKSTKNLSLTPNFSFGQKPKQDISKEEINKSSEKNEKKETNNNFNTNNNINNQSMNWNLGINNGFTRLLGNNSNIFGLNDTNPFIGNNTLNYNSFYENTNLFKSNLNNSNLFKIEHTRHLNDVNQLSQMSYINRAEERNINNSFIGNDNNTLINENNNNINNNTEEINNYKEEKEKGNDKEFLGKKRKNEEKNQKKEKKNNNAKNNNKEKKSKKNSNSNSDNNALKTPSFNYNNVNDLNYNNINQTQNRINNLRMGFRGINNPNYNYNMNNNINNYQNFPYNIDIPLPSKFFEESNNNFKK